MIMWRIVKHTEIAPWHYGNDELLFCYNRRLLAKAWPEPGLRCNARSAAWEETIKLKYSKNGDLQKRDLNQISDIAQNAELGQVFQMQYII